MAFNEDGRFVTDSSKETWVTKEILEALNYSLNGEVTPARPVNVKMSWIDEINSAYDTPIEQIVAGVDNSGAKPKDRALSIHLLAIHPEGGLHIGKLKPLIGDKQLSGYVAEALYVCSIHDASAIIATIGEADLKALEQSKTKFGARNVDRGAVNALRYTLNLNRYAKGEPAACSVCGKPTGNILVGLDHQESESVRVKHNLGSRKFEGCIREVDAQCDSCIVEKAGRKGQGKTPEALVHEFLHERTGLMASVGPYNIEDMLDPGFQPKFIGASPVEAEVFTNVMRDYAAELKGLMDAAASGQGSLAVISVPFRLHAGYRALLTK